MELLNFIRDYGLPGFLLVVLFLIVQDPERAVKLQALIIKPFFNLFKWGSKQYIASEVGYTSTEFLRRHIASYIPSVSNPTVRIKWVTSPSDPIFHRDGTLIIRLQETNDQTRNILTATRVALPHVLFPLLRNNIEQYAQGAIDLTILKSMSDKLGKHAQPIFQRYFLTPEIEEDNRAAELFTDLIKIDEAGIFVQIFLEELTLLGEDLFATGDISDKTNDIVSFLKYLLSLATRNIGQNVQLEYFSPNFKVEVMLLAMSWKAETHGLLPYLKRIDKNINAGCDSIYIASYSNAWDFLRRLATALNKDKRLTQVKWNTVPRPTTNTQQESGITEILLYRRNAIFEDNDFSENINKLGIKIGALVHGTVFDVSQSTAMVDLGGIYGVVSVEDSSWLSQTNCRDVLHPSHEYDFLVKAVQFNKNLVELSRRLPKEDPWQKSVIPAIGQVIEVDIQFFKDGNYLCTTDDGLEIHMAREEITWGLSNENGGDLLGSRKSVRVIDVLTNEKKIMASLRQLIQDPWPILHKELVHGTEITAKILAIQPNNIIVELPNHIQGYIPRQYVREAGYEYTKFIKGLTPGQPLKSIISKVFLQQKKIRLMLPPKNQQTKK